MAPDNWQRLQEIFESASAVPEGERAQYLERACAGDTELRGRVGALLATSEGTKMIENAIGEAAAEAARPGAAELAPGSKVGR